MTVLQWLRSDARSFKPFVAHRLGEIIENSCVSDWRWVPTDLNVADDATRTRSINLDASHRWFRGPSFLFKSFEDWPTEPRYASPNTDELKTNSFELVGLTSFVEELPTPVTAIFANFSNWQRLLRATARVLQAAAKFGVILASFRNSKLKGEVVCARHPSASTTLPPLSADLIKAAERQILQRTQLESFSIEFLHVLNSKPIPPNSRLKKLSPALGEDKLLRLAGRIKAAEGIDPDTRFPILLDGRHPIVRLLVQFYHRKAGHANYELVVNELRQKYWLLRLRNTVRTVAKECLICRIRKSLPVNPKTGDLPPERLAHHRRPFTFTGLDYFGPISVTIGRRHEKRYVALFTCLTVRALHLEMVHSLSTDSAIMAIRRFIARRGSPDTIFSDNGTCFVGANRILREFYGENVEDFMSTQGIRWKFTPPAAPNFGGCWERLVRSVKVALNATLTERAPKEETLSSLLAEAEAIVNSRPLTHVSTDPDDPTTLTTFHFLIGSSSMQTLPTALNDHDLVSRSEWRKALRLADHFWSRWMREVLPTLQPREQPRGNRSSTALQEGDIVIIADSNLPRGTWPRGRVAKTYCGKDQVIRVVDVTTAGGMLRRPVRKLVRLST
ncbi:uncharacterized protein LOC123721811 [Papilio machaon]|uniref:uncharacterized protein LOC123721811 n=1 Tax=Papilio machaon TaxID=76193 RepID=UPI001E665D0E|nr:uncharacterized protein LOC123721811 [Papilio machaon]